MHEQARIRRRRSNRRLLALCLLGILGYGSLCVALLGCYERLLVPVAQKREPSLIRMFRENRTEIEVFAAHYRNLPPGAGYVLPKCFDIGGLGYERGHYPEFTTEGDCLLFDWRWGPPFSCDECLMHSPRGLEGIPARYQADGSNGIRVELITETWFYVGFPGGR